MEALNATDVALAYFENLSAAQLMAVLEYLYVRPESPTRQMQLSALFQVWIARDAAEAMAAAEKGGVPIEKVAVASWAKVDLNAAWSWVVASGALRGDYALGLVGGAAAINRESVVAGWLTPFESAFEMDAAIKELARIWAGKDPAAAVRWLQVLEAGEDQAWFQAIKTLGIAGTTADVIGGAISGRPVEEVVKLVQQQSEYLGTLMLTAAAKKWVAADQISRIGEFENLSSQMSTDRVDAVTAVIVLGIAVEDPQYALRLVRKLNDLPKKRLTMIQAWTALLGKGKGEQAMSFAIAYPAEEGSDPVHIVYEKWKALQPEQARAYLDQSSLAPQLRARLEPP